MEASVQKSLGSSESPPPRTGTSRQSTKLQASWDYRHMSLQCQNNSYSSTETFNESKQKRPRYISCKKQTVFGLENVHLLLWREYITHLFIMLFIYLFTYLFVHVFINYTTLPETLSVAHRMMREYWMAKDEECSDCGPALIFIPLMCRIGRAPNRLSNILATA
jgi:hypothetical protein